MIYVAVLTGVLVVAAAVLAYRRGRSLLFALVMAALGLVAAIFAPPVGLVFSVLVLGLSLTL